MMYLYFPGTPRIWQCRGMASLILNLGTRWKQVVSSKFLILYPCKRSDDIQNLGANLDVGERKYLFPMFGIEL